MKNNGWVVNYNIFFYFCVTIKLYYSPNYSITNITNYTPTIVHTALLKIICNVKSLLKINWLCPFSLGSVYLASHKQSCSRVGALKWLTEGLYNKQSSAVLFGLRFTFEWFKSVILCKQSY